MDIILRLIVRLFEAIFEEDVSRRQQQRQATLEDWLAQAGGSQPPPTKQDKKKKVSKPTPQPKPTLQLPPTPLPILDQKKPKPPKKKVDFTLPGKTPIEQLIYAQMIMGPCLAVKARRGRGMRPPVFEGQGKT